jgi:hypothetical protein
MDRESEELAEVEAKLVGFSSIFDFSCYVNFYILDDTLVLRLGQRLEGQKWSYKR